MNSRAFNSMRNTTYAFASQGIVSIMAFITRTIFIYALGNTYLGLSGLFGDILTFLSLAELGVGTAIIYSMYKPLANDDKKMVSALVNLYGKIYFYMGIIVTTIGLSLTPFLSFFISDMPDIPELNLIYILYLLNTSLSYFFIYKKSMLIATQNSHIISIIQASVVLIQNILQITFLLIFKSFIIYLIIQIVCVLLNNICISIYVDRKYEYLKEYKKERVNKETKREILKNVSAMFLNKISSVIVTSTDNILISKFVSTIVLGYYSNYILFTNLVRQIFSKIFESITGGIGNLVSTESKEKSYETFEKIFFANFWIIAFISTMLFIMVNPFIELWLGKTYLLSMSIVFLICFNLYMRFIRDTSLTFIETCGLFWSIKWKCIFEAVINLISSILYLKYFKLGIAGVLLGTLTSNLLTNFWYEPYIIYKNKFNVSVKNYYIKFLRYTIVALVAGGIAYLGCRINLTGNRIIEFGVDLILASIVINFIYFCCFFKTAEFKYFKNIIIKVLKK